MDKSFYRDTWAEIDLDAIYNNICAMKARLEEDVRLCAVVKADGYGHGDIQVAETALEAGADFLAVAFLDEAIGLRNKGITAPILVLGAIRACDAHIASEYSISVTVFRKEWLLEAAEGSAYGKPLCIHLKCDTGMGRIGFRTAEELMEAEEILNEMECMELEGLYTHFACADGMDLSYYERQKEKFSRFIRSLRKKPPLIHCSNSAAALRFPDIRYDAVRFGISMYGLSPSPEMNDLIPFPLEEAFSLYTTITNVKRVDKGECIGYGASYQAENPEWIATLPIGYADGWIRKLSGQEVLIEGKRMPIVGRVCMDQCMVRLPGPYPVGTKVVLIGSNGDDKVSVDEIAEKLDTINYEVTCMISRRVPRIYKRHKEIKAVRNDLL